LEKISTKESIITGIIALLALFILEYDFPTKQKSVITCNDQTCTITEYNSQGDFESSKVVNTEECRDLRIVQEEKFNSGNLFRRHRKLYQTMYTIGYMGKDTKTHRLFDTFGKSSSKTYKALLTINQGLQQKPVNVNFTFTGR